MGWIKDFFTGIGDSLRETAKAKTANDKILAQEAADAKADYDEKWDYYLQTKKEGESITTEGNIFLFSAIGLVLITLIVRRL